jgi:hypothetical protein
MRTITKFLALFCLLMGWDHAMAQSPARISIQGTLMNDIGVAAPNASHDVEFILYDAPTGGNAVWSEMASVRTNGGIYSYYLGTNVPLNNSIFQSTLFLAVKIGSLELPRTELTYTPYTFAANSTEIADEVRCSGAVGDVKYSILSPALFTQVNGDCWVPMSGGNIFGSELAAVLGTNTIPDISGLFIRAHEYNDGQDPNRTPTSPIAQFQDQAWKSHEHPTTVSAAGGHSHTWADQVLRNEGGALRFMLDVPNRMASNADEVGNFSHTHTINITSSGGNETRPINLNLYTYIRIN